MTTPLFNVKDWFELQHQVDELESEWGLSDEEKSVFQKSMDYIKEQLGLHTEPTMVKSDMTDTYYVTDLWQAMKQENGKFLMITHSKRKATEKEIADYLEMIEKKQSEQSQNTGDEETQ